MNALRVECNLGFDGRIFLTEAEWRTYLRRKPVRYIRRPKAAACKICGEGPKDENPLQSAHLIGFDFGIVQLALTPEFLDGESIIVTAHRTRCNMEAELNLEDAMALLYSLGERELPSFLPPGIRSLWADVVVSK
jgi:hypothetical protein